MSDVRVRQALLSIIDRQALADVMTATSPVAGNATSTGRPALSADRPLHREVPLRPVEGRAVAQRAGWNKGPDGVYVRASDGQRLELDFWTRPAPGQGGEHYCQQLEKTARASPPRRTSSPAARRTDREYQVTRLPLLRARGPHLRERRRGDDQGDPHRHGNWAGLNYGGYAKRRASSGSSASPRPSTRATASPSPTARPHVHRGRGSDAPLWEVCPMFMLQGVKGPRPAPCSRSPTCSSGISPEPLPLRSRVVVEEVPTSPLPLAGEGWGW